MGHSWPLFLYFRIFNAVDNNQMFYIKFSLAGFEPRTSGVGSDHSATTTAHVGTT